jgi:biopolymer transport protein TolR
MAFGRMERSSAAPPMGDINMTPLIDVMLVLMVIFMITAPLMVSAVKVDLPRSQGAQALDAAPFMAVLLDPAGRVYVNDALLDKPALAQAFGAAAQRNPDTEVRLRADAKVPYGRVVEVMGLAQKAGLNRIGFVAEPEASDSP